MAGCVGANLFAGVDRFRRPMMPQIHDGAFVPTAIRSIRLPDIGNKSSSISSSSFFVSSQLVPFLVLIFQHKRMGSHREALSLCHHGCSAFLNLRQFLPSLVQYLHKQKGNVDQWDRNECNVLCMSNFSVT